MFQVRLDNQDLVLGYLLAKIIFLRILPPRDSIKVLIIRSEHV